MRDLRDLTDVEGVRQPAEHEQRVEIEIGNLLPNNQRQRRTCYAEQEQRVLRLGRAARRSTAAIVVRDIVIRICFRFDVLV